jgi:4'-phosphopantetheinyl transferase
VIGNISVMPAPQQHPVTPESQFLLRDHEAHVWYAALDPAGLEEERWGNLLSSDERQRAARFKFKADSFRFASARGQLRQLLAEYLGTGPCEIQFAYSDSGKPELAGKHHHGDVQFNVSHSGDLVTIAITKGRKIGVDIEFLRYDLDVDAISKRFFSTHEQQALAGLPEAQKYAGFFNCWTRKEAYVKAVGTGLSLPLRDFDVSLVPGEPARLLATRPDSRIAGGWSMAALSVHHDFVAAVVVEGPAPDLKVQPFTPAGAPSRKVL